MDPYPSAMGPMMESPNSDFEVYEPTSSPLDHACTWVTDSVRKPLRLLIAAVLCPVVFSIMGQVEFIFQWNLIFGDETFGSSMTLLALAPCASIALVFASRAMTSLAWKSALCASAGLLVIFTASYYVSWVVAAFCLGLACVAVGNRVGKQFTHVRTPKVLAGVGGVTLLSLYCMPVAGAGTDSLISILFTGSTWTDGWMFAPLIFAVFAYGLMGIGLCVPHQRRETVATAASITVRAVLIWTPIAFLAGAQEIAFMFGGGLGGGAGVTTITLGFKFFGIAYSILYLTGLGAASWFTGWLWGRLGCETGPEGFDDDGFAAPVEPEPQLVEV